jgi:hypothetical protein
MNRRGFLFSAATFIAAPAIVRASSLMPIRPQPQIILDLEVAGGIEISHMVRDPKTGIVMRKTVSQILAQNSWMPHFEPMARPLPQGDDEMSRWMRQRELEVRARRERERQKLIQAP